MSELPGMPEPISVMISRAEVPIKTVRGWEDAPLDGALVASIREHGLLNAPAVEWCERDQAWDVVAGRRRARAWNHLHVEWIADEVRDKVDPGQSPYFFIPISVISNANPYVLALTENSRRSSNPIVELAALRALEEAGKTEAQIAKLTGMSIATQRKRKRLAKLPPEITAGVLEGTVTTATAEQVAALDPTRQQALVETLGNFGRLTEADVKEMRTARMAQHLEQLVIPETEADPDEWVRNAQLLAYQLYAEVPISAPDDLKEALQFITERLGGMS